MHSKYPVQPLTFAVPVMTPKCLTTQAGTVTLWAAPSEADSLSLQRWQEMLSDEERARAQRFRFQPDREQFIATRGTLRMLLAQYLNVAPATLQFAYGNNGKPYLLTATGKRAPLRFNVSHAKGLAMFALAWNCELGIDIEPVRRELADEATARLVLTPTEFSTWRNLAAAAQPVTFFHLWTSKEAYLKTLGAGLSVAPDTIAITLNEAAQPQWIEIPAAPASWAFYHFVPYPDYVGALALNW